MRNILTIFLGTIFFHPVGRVCAERNLFNMLLSIRARQGFKLFYWTCRLIISAWNRIPFKNNTTFSYYVQNIAAIIRVGVKSPPSAHCSICSLYSLTTFLFQNTQSIRQASPHQKPKTVLISVPSFSSSFVLAILCGKITQWRQRKPLSRSKA